MHRRKFSTALFPERLLRSDLVWIVGILLLTFLVRIPNLSEPQGTIFDESIYANYTIRHIEQVPYIDIHPPLARSVFAITIEKFPFLTTAIGWQTNAPFHDFPFLPLRILMVFFGTLVPVLLYAIGRGLGLAPPWAGIAGILAAIEPGFIIFSRIMVPDMMLIAFGFAGLAMVLAIRDSSSRSARIAFAIIAGIFFGAAVSIKWSALGLLATGIFALFLSQRYILSILIGGTALGIYVAIFMWFLSIFPLGGRIEPVVPLLFVESGSSIIFPSSSGTKLNVIAELHRVMYAAQSNQEFIRGSAAGEPPITWAIGASFLPLWLSDNGTRQITLLANPLLWGLAFLLFILALVASSSNNKTPKARDIPGFGPRHLPLILAVGYFGNYLPFFLIERPMYLYHYFVALAFLYLALPWGLREGWRMLSRTISSQRLRIGLACLLVALVACIHVMLISFTYAL